MDLERRKFLINSLKLGAITYIAPKTLLSISQNKTTADIFIDIIKKASKQRWFEMDIDDLIARVANEFLGTPYVGGTLDNNLDKEEITVNLKGLDCVTFVENSLCIARCIKKQNFRYIDLLNEINLTRYRSGKLNDYTSRLHYTSEWILDNIEKNIIEDITERLGGKEHYFDVHFMSKYSEKYPILKKHKEYVPKIQQVEEKLRQHKFFVINQNNIAKISSKIHDGAIICIATSRAGLDYSHLGLAFNKHLMHASSKYKKVVLGKKIADYVKSNRSAIGITVLRPLSPMS